ncbi:MAG: hypothetical protein CML94_02165 [Rhodobiaceae bacterium]|nr:hypothetical protein [Rhodobiaceae bacterium]
MELNFENSFAKELKDFYEFTKADKSTSPKLIKFNESLAKELGPEWENLKSDYGLLIFSGNVVPKGSQPLSQAYSGHQFGGFSPLLGDGRAILLGEVIDKDNIRRDIQLKGSGRTIFSRGGDGKSSLGPVLREYLISEAMHSLNIPTTRALAAVSSGDDVLREKVLPGGILTRVASSHIRVGTFQYASTTGDLEKIRALSDYSINRHYKNISQKKEKYIDFFEAVCESQLNLVSKWMGIGFIHGVMNTDNMTISGETIDYGPCAFMDRYDPNTFFSSIDTQGRYAYLNQPLILLWNLARFAETLIPLIDKNEQNSINILTQKLSLIQGRYENAWLKVMSEKIGITVIQDGDLKLINDLLDIMKNEKADFTLVFRYLADFIIGKEDLLLSLFENSKKINEWIINWKNRIEKEGKFDKSLCTMMKKINPLYIPRNHLVEYALDEALLEENYKPFYNLLSHVTNPFDEISSSEDYTLPAPITDKPYKTFCGT